MENSTKDNHFSYLVIFAAVVVIFALIFVFLFLRNKGMNKNSSPGAGFTQNIVSSPTSMIVKTKKGGIVLKTSDGLTKKSLGQTFTVDAILASPETQLASFDMLINYDKSKLDLVKSQPGIDGFQLVIVQDSDGVAITAFKSPSSKLLHNIDQVKLLSLSFRPKAKGKMTVAVVKEKGKRTTKFIDRQTKIYYPEVGETEIEIN